MSESRSRSSRGDRPERFERREPAAAGGAAPQREKPPVSKLAASGTRYIDYKESESLRRLCSANGKIGSRRRTSATALEQRMVAIAVKRARFMALLPYQTAAQ